MTIDKVVNGEAFTIKIAGRIDTMTAPELENEIVSIDESTKDLILDMTGVEYISSAGLRVLLAAQKKMGKVGSMRLTGVCDNVMEVLEMTGFADILVIE
ncbi:MAG: STAS domain-containing protein [Clostridia bacterium]|nr:STAS domain-containing protein [Clostridia bacterium]